MPVWLVEVHVLVAHVAGRPAAVLRVCMSVYGRVDELESRSKNNWYLRRVKSVSKPLHQAEAAGIR